MMFDDFEMMPMMAMAAAEPMMMERARGAPMEKMASPPPAAP